MNLKSPLRITQHRRFVPINRDSPKFLLRKNFFFAGNVTRHKEATEMKYLQFVVAFLLVMMLHGCGSDTSKIEQKGTVEKVSDGNIAKMQEYRGPKDTPQGVGSPKFTESNCSLCPKGKANLSYGKKKIYRRIATWI